VKCGDLFGRQKIIINISNQSCDEVVMEEIKDGCDKVHCADIMVEDCKL